MSFDHVVSLVSAIIAFTGLIFVGLQLRVANRQREDANRQREDAIRQRESDSLVKLYDINRQLICFAIDRPALLKILEDENIADPLIQKRYLQMWLNQLSVSHSFLKHLIVQVELQDELRRNLTDFMSMKIMQKHWHQYGSFYPTSFQECVNDILKKDEPPAAAHVKATGSQAAKT